MHVTVTSDQTGGPPYVRLHDPDGQPTGVGVRPAWDVIFKTDDEDPHPGVVGHIKVAVEGGRPVVGELALTVQPPDEVTSDLLRWISVPWLLATSQFLTSVAVIGDGEGFAVRDPAELDQARELAASGKRVRLGSLVPEVARVYLAHPDAPTRAVAEHFGKPHKTAQRWVLRARTEGFLPATAETPRRQRRSAPTPSFGEGATVTARFRYRGESMPLEQLREFFAARDRRGDAGGGQ